MYATQYQSSVSRRLVPTGDQTTTSATAVSITGLSASVNANSVYEVNGFLHLGCNNTGGVKYTFTFPSGATMFVQIFGLNTTATDGGVNNSITASGTLTANTFCNANNANGRVRFSGTLTVGATAGTLQMQHASGTAGQTSTVFQEGSVITLTRIS